jgi:integrase
MGKGINRLPASYQKLKPGLHSDGNCLYLQVSDGPNGNRRRSWIFRYTLAGRKSRDMGLGGTSYVSLADARELARHYKALVKQGVDPITARDTEIAKNLAASATVMTFDEAARQYITQHRHEWVPEHAAEWPATLERYASPRIGRMSVADIGTADVLAILQPIWLEKTETAKRLRGRIEKILGWAATSGYRTGTNPATWRGHLENLLAKPSKIKKTVHQPALPYVEIPGFLQQLRSRSGITPLALEFAVLTGVRSVDVRHAKRADINKAERTWDIPEFSKTGAAHRVPLTPAMWDVIEKAETIKAGIGGAVGKSAFLFPNDLTGAALGKNAMVQLLGRMGFAGRMTAHGARASFRTFLQERTAFSRELCELCLGHKIESPVELAYARSNQVEKRRAIMTAWSDFCTRPATPADVVPIRKKRG